MIRGLSWQIACLVLVAISACGGKAETTAEGGGATAGGSGGAPIDPACYDACLEKGEPADLCAAYCGEVQDKDGGTGGKAGGTGGKAGGTGGSTGGTGGGTGGVGGEGGSGANTGGSGGKIDPGIEKPCVECLYDVQLGGSCLTEMKACEESLACTQLQWCPSLCGEPDCLEECNQIIPSGVAPLTALVWCMACDGGPCASACQGAVILSYCK